MTKVTGASDDLIEINGDINKEFNSIDCDNGIIAFSDGTLLKVVYDEDGLWRFTVKIKGSLFNKKDEGSISDDTNDIIYFKEGLVWCAFSNDMKAGYSEK